MFASVEDEQTQGCDATVSPNNESETGDFDADPNYSSSDDSYSDPSDNMSSLIKNKIPSFDEINVATLNGPQNTDFTAKKKKQGVEEQKIKIAVPSEWKINKTEF